jgi:type IV secretion system protein VirB10
MKLMEEARTPSSEPGLIRNLSDPKGVLRKNLKPMLYLAAAILVIVAAVISGRPKKNSSDRTSTPGEAPQPLLQDATETNLLDLKNQVATARQKSPAVESVQPAPGGPSQASAAVPDPSCGGAMPCPQRGVAQPAQLTPVQQEVEQLAARDRALEFEARFSSNLVFVHAADAQPQRANLSLPVAQSPTQPMGVPSAKPAPGGPLQVSDQSAGQATGLRKPEVNLDSALGQPYVLYEGTTVDTVLMNRLDGDAPGPVKVLISNPVYSHDRQHELIPAGTIALGEARKIGSTGFGQQRRLALVFHRMIMPDGYSVDLDQFQGLDQIGEEGVKDKVNNHYLQIFGTSIALGIVAGAGQIEQGGGTLTTSGSQAFTTGAAANVSQSASTILDRFLEIPATLTVREGHRIKLYFTQDMLLPAYENHRVSQTF